MIHNLGFIAWKDELSWMESMKGSRWKSMIEKENNIFLKQLKVSEDLITAKSHDFEHSRRTILFHHKAIVLNYVNGSEIEWNYVSDNSKKYSVTDIFVYDDFVYQIRDTGKGAENYVLECLKGHKILWTKKNVGSNVIVVNNLCYFLSSEKKLWYNSLHCVNAKSGDSEKCIYREINKTFNLTLELGDNNCIFLLRENSGKQNLFVIEKDNIIYKNIILQYYIPIGYYKSKICYLYSNGQTWKSSGFSLKKQFSNNVLYASLKNNVIILIENGLRKMYDFDFKLLCTYYGNFIYNPLAEHHFESYFIDIAGAGIVEYSNHKPIECISYYGTVKRHMIKQVPTVVITPNCKPKALICIGYGAYNTPTNMSTTRWKPFIDAGWIVSFICVRGSGDVDLHWGEAAKTVQKEASFIDFENCIKELQKHYKISPKDTCIYGRSAGGYLVGAVVSRNPEGYLFKIVYTEVPYVDVLNTTSNPNLPLTSQEYEEFGNPSNSIFEFRKIMEYSPVDSLMKSPDLYVLIRTAENDNRVSTYEVYKWLTMLRKDKLDKQKIVYCSKNSGHFVHSFTNYSQDFFLLNSFRA